MKNNVKGVTVEELTEIVQYGEGEFIIHVELGKGEKEDGERKNKLEVVSVRLVKEAPILSNHPIQSPKDAVEVLGEILCEWDREVFCVINLKTDGTPINCHIASIGAINASIACPRELFKSSILSNAANMILVHNHPSGSLKPSIDDIKITEIMIKLCEMMQIPLLDHVIVGGTNNDYYSFNEHKMLKSPHVVCDANRQGVQFHPSREGESCGKYGI